MPDFEYIPFILHALLPEISVYQHCEYYTYDIDVFYRIVQHSCKN